MQCRGRARPDWCREQTWENPQVLAGEVAHGGENRRCFSQSLDELRFCESCAVRWLGHLTRVWLIAIALLGWTPGVLAEGAVWKQKHLLVDDYTSEVWQPVIAETVASFKAVLPKRAPQLVYRSLGEQSCDSLPEYGQPRTI